jgi:transposase
METTRGNASPYQLFMLALCVYALAALGVDTLCSLSAQTHRILAYSDTVLAVGQNRPSLRDIGYTCFLKEEVGMANGLKMAVIHAIEELLNRGWSHRRIARELGVHRETVARYERLGRSKPAISTPGSGPPPYGRKSHCDAYLDLIRAKLDQGLCAQRIYQDLRTETDFAGSYSSVKRFARRLGFTTPLPFRRIEVEPGKEAQVDFGSGPWVIQDGHRCRTHVLRITLSHSRKGYSEAIHRQTCEGFIRCLENAWRHFGGVPAVLVPDNLKAAVTKADWFDPDLNPKIVSFARHYGFAILPTRPASPREKGKIESGIKYVKNNAVKGRTFGSLAPLRQAVNKDRNHRSNKPKSALSWLTL